MNSRTELVTAVEVKPQDDGVRIQFAREVNGCIFFSCDFTRSGKIKCPLCSVTFISIDAIILHLNKPHTQCLKCDGAYVNLTKHMKRHDEFAVSHGLDKATRDFVERQVKKGYSLYEIDKSLTYAFSYFVP